VPLNRSGLAGRVFFLGKQVEELIGGQGIDLYSADGCGRGAHLEPNRKFVLECAERRLRAGWRVLVFLVMTFVVAAVDGLVRAGCAAATAP